MIYFLPSHFWVISLNLCPAGHLHSKDPTVLIQFPPWQMPGIAWHSSTSVHTEGTVNTHSQEGIRHHTHAQYLYQSMDQKLCFNNLALTFLQSTKWRGKIERGRGTSSTGGTEAKLTTEKTQQHVHTDGHSCDHMQWITVTSPASWSGAPGLSGFKICFSVSIADD